MTGNSNKKLPSGWRWVKLGDVCEINPSRPLNLQRADDEPTTFVPMQAVDGNLGIIAQPQIKPFLEVRKGYTYFAENDVLFAKITPCMENGKHAIANNLIDGIGFGTTEFHVIRPKDQIISEWVHKLVRQPKIWKLASEHFIGSVGQQRVPKEFLTNLLIPLAPLAEQKRIAAILNEQIAAVEQARKAAIAQLEAAEALPKAYLREVFESEEAQTWEKKRLGDVAKLERGKFTPRPRNDPRYYGGQYPWIQTGEVERCNKYIKNYKNTLNEHGLLVSKMFPKGTLVITIAATIGAVGILAFDSCMPDSLVGIKPIPELSDTEFLYYTLEFIRNYLKSIAPQVAQANLKLSLLEPIKIAIPPLSEQNRIAAYLTEKLAECDRLKQSLTEQLEAINQLPKALLSRAFNGELEKDVIN